MMQRRLLPCRSQLRWISRGTTVSDDGEQWIDRRDRSSCDRERCPDYRHPYRRRRQVRCGTSSAGSPDTRRGRTVIDYKTTEQSDEVRNGRAYPYGFMSNSIQTWQLMFASIVETSCKTMNRREGHNSRCTHILILFGHRLKFLYLLACSLI